MRTRIKNLWWALLAGGLAALTGIGAVVRSFYRDHRWRKSHVPGPIA